MAQSAVQNSFDQATLGKDRSEVGSIWDWLVRVGERSAGARGAKAYAALSALSDAELAARGLKRDGLLLHCFGARAYC